MKTLILALLAIAPLAASAADFGGCKAKFTASADEYAAYMAQQTEACVAEMNKGGAERSRVKIIMNCKNALAILQPMKDRSSAACNECKDVDAKFSANGGVCSDEGAQKYIDRVRAL